MHDLLKSQLQSLGLSEASPPTAEEWQRFLDYLSLDYLDTQLQRKDQDLQQQLEEVVLLNRVIAAVSSTSETTTVLSIVCRELAECLDLSHVTCALLNQERSELQIVAEYIQNQAIHTTIGTVLPIVNESITQYLLKNRGPVISYDVRQDQRLTAARIIPDIDHETVSSMLVPLMTKGRVIGIISLNDQKPREFTKREITLAQNVAAASSQALENAQLYEELTAKYEHQRKTEQLLRHQNAYLGALHETMLSMMQRLDLSILLEDIIEHAGNLLGTRHGFLYVVEGDHLYPVLRAGIGIFRHAIGTHLNGSDSLGARVWREGKMVVNNNIEHLVLNDINLGKTYAGIGVPLKSDGRTAGVIGLVHLQEKQSFSTEQAEVLERFAQLASLGIDNAKLYSAAQQEITERQKVERNLEEAKKMAESASRAKSTFLARMSHELRTPLTAIIGYSDIMQEELRELQQEHLEEDVIRIRRSAQILLELINDVLDLSKIESGEVTMYLQDFDIADLIHDVVGVSHPLIKKGGNRLDLNISPYLGSIKADMVKLRQVLLNLVGNAAKFTHDGMITITGRRNGEKGVEMIEIEVTDTGIGISPEQHSAIFEPFIQADDSTTRQYGGTGLGLAISRRFCQLMGGDILLESTPNEGSSFTIRLPAEPVLVPKSSKSSLIV